MHRVIKRGLKTALLAACFSATAGVCQSSSTPVCSIADIESLLSATPTCSTDGAVFFGSDINSFILSQCSTISNDTQSAADKSKAQNDCRKCAKTAALAFKFSVKAKLFTASGSSVVSESKIKQLCKITDSGDDSGSGDGRHEPPESDAVKSMFSQLHLCLPQPDQSVDVTQCTSCVGTVLDSALSSGVINRNRYTVLKGSAERVCSGAPSGGGDSGGGHSGDGHGGNPTPNPYEAFFRGLHSCFEQYRSPDHVDAAACATCIAAVPTTDLDAGRIAAALTAAGAMCDGTFVPHEGAH